LQHPGNVTGICLLYLFMTKSDYNFDEIIERRSTDALKWVQYGEEVIPLWVADSDFKTAPAIIDRLNHRVNHGVYGYHLTAHNKSANQAVVDWINRRHQWQIEAEWIVWVPGVVTAVNGACRAFCNPGQKALVQKPNYPPLLAAPALNQLQLETVETIMLDGRWTLDFDELERKATDPDTRIFILCDPMNPCGSVLTREELQKIERICLENDVLLCSDEIHCDLVLDENETHIPAGSLSDIGNNAITLMAASKTFNIAGLATSLAIIPDRKIRKQFTKTTIGMQLWVNIFGMEATEAAFTLSDEWYDAQLDYLRGNRDFLQRAFSKLEGFEYKPAAATYLAWVNASGLGVDNIQQYLLDKGIAPSPGNNFGWAGYSRFNFACPRSFLEEAVKRLAD